MRNIPIVRRLSGGGTVYHDRGNVNFAFIYNEGKRQTSHNFQMIKDVLQSFDIPIILNSRKDLLYETYKVSGNAFYRRGKRRLHHGTLLIDVDTSSLWDLLNFDHKYMSTSSVNSVRSNVINLKQVSPELTVDAFIDNISDVFAGDRVIHDQELLVNHYDEVQKLYTKYKNWSWLFGETPRFTYQRHGLEFIVNHGVITQVNDERYEKMINEPFDVIELTKEVTDVSRII